MKLIPFKYNKKKYFFLILEKNFNPSETNFINTKINNIYQKCFNNLTNYDSLINFTKNKGINILIFNSNLDIIFISSFIKNYYTKNIELFNVCKKLDDHNIEVSVILKYIISRFIFKISLFSDYKKIVLSVLLSNKFIVPTILCYQNIGFSYSDKIPMSTPLPPYFSMILDIEFINSLSKDKKIEDFLSIINDNNINLNKIYYLLTKKKTNKNKDVILTKIKTYLSKSIS